MLQLSVLEVSQSLCKSMSPQTFDVRFGLSFSRRWTAYVRTKTRHNPWRNARQTSSWVSGEDYWHYSGTKPYEDDFLAGAAPSGGRLVRHDYRDGGSVQSISIRSNSPHSYRDLSGLALTAELDRFSKWYLQGLGERPSLEETVRRSYSDLELRPFLQKDRVYQIKLTKSHKLHSDHDLAHAVIDFDIRQHLSSPSTYWNFGTVWRPFKHARLTIEIRSSHIFHAPPLVRSVGVPDQTWDRSHPMWKLAENELACLRFDPVLELHLMLKKSAGRVCSQTSIDPPLVPLLSAFFALADSRNDFPYLHSVRIYIKQAYELPQDGRQKHGKYTENPQLKLTRTEYARLNSNFALNSSPSSCRTAYVAMGSNLGDPVKNIEKACQEMAKAGIMVTRSSLLYLSKPMYFEEQENFVNCVCEVETNHEPMQLLTWLKKIEDDLGRVKTIDNGPRPIDLDILLYENVIFESERLSIPHKKMMEREFVLRPLCDIIPDRTSPTQNPLVPFSESLKFVDNSCVTFTPLSKSKRRVAPLTAHSPNRATKLMAIVNMTPDSFSDGGLYNKNDAASAVDSVLHTIGQSDVVSVIDIGGQSTRPHAVEVSAEEEMKRVVPVIKELRANPALDEVAISIDTYRSTVAAAAVAAGADIVNDVSAGQLDAQMLPTIAELGCPCILMHMRGTPETMNKLTEYENGIIEGVGTELRLRVQDAEKAGIKRWRIILDPGIGFAKTQAHNLELLQRLEELRNYKGLEGLPWVVGASRKKFIGKITGIEDPSARQFGSAVCVTAAVRGGADMVRVHDVGEMTQVVKMADAIFRV